MIHVTRLNGKAFVLHVLHIESVEETPDTVITLTSGKKYLVRESAAEIISRTVEFYRQASIPHVLPATRHDEEQGERREP